MGPRPALSFLQAGSQLRAEGNSKKTHLLPEAWYFLNERIFYFFSGGRPIRSKQLLNPVHASSKTGLNLQLKETGDHRI